MKNQLLGILILGLMGLFILSACTSTPDKTLKANVRFTGTQFVITNLDAFDCLESRMEVNNGYYLKGYTLGAGQSYTVGAAEFAKDDGTRFNSFTTKAQSFYIGCKGGNELSGAYWYGEWK
jgi:hypothetical protein